MYAIIFEVQPKPGCMDEYLRLAGKLRPELDRIDGFLAVDRFASRRSEGRILSFSTWRDEAAVVRWREHGEHRKAQARGRYQIFADYRLRVAELIGSGAAAEAAAPQLADTRPRLATVTELAADARCASGALDFADLTKRFDGEEPVEYDAFESIYTPGKRLFLASWRDAQAAGAWEARAALDTAPADSGVRQLRFRIVRDYGPKDRQEAPERRAGPDRSATPHQVAAGSMGAEPQPGGRQP